MFQRALAFLRKAQRVITLVLDVVTASALALQQLVEQRKVRAMAVA